MRVVLLLVVVLVTGEKQSQLLVLGLRLEFDKNKEGYQKLFISTTKGLYEIPVLGLGLGVDFVFPLSQQEQEQEEEEEEEQQPSPKSTSREGTIGLYAKFQTCIVHIHLKDFGEGLFFFLLFLLFLL